VQTIQRCTRVSENGSCIRYFVDELIGGEQEGEWIDSSTMEMQRGGSIPEPCAEKPANNASKGLGAEKDACEQGRTQSVIVKDTTCPSNRIAAWAYSLMANSPERRQAFAPERGPTEKRGSRRTTLSPW
jgi:hypothetical protein